MSGLRAGREAQAMATFISMPDQMAALTPSTENNQFWSPVRGTEE